MATIDGRARVEVVARRPVGQRIRRRALVGRDVVAARRGARRRAADLDARVAGVPERVGIPVLLIQIGNGRTVVAGVADAVAVAVRLARVGDARTHITSGGTEGCVRAVAVAVDVGLARVDRARIAQVADAVGVAIRLVEAGKLRAVVADVAVPVAVAVGLIRIEVVRTGVAAQRASDAVPVAVVVERRAVGRTWVAGVADAVRLRVGLVGIEDAGAVVEAVVQAVAVVVAAFDDLDAQRAARRRVAVGAVAGRFDQDRVADDRRHRDARLQVAGVVVAREGRRQRAARSVERGEHGVVGGPATGPHADRAVRRRLDPVPDGRTASARTDLGIARLLGRLRRGDRLAERQRGDDDGVRAVVVRRWSSGREPREDDGQPDDRANEPLAHGTPRTPGRMPG
jgi:hypothetical protein